MFDSYIKGGMVEETKVKNVESVHCRQFLLTMILLRCNVVIMNDIIGPDLEFIK